MGEPIPYARPQLEIFPVCWLFNPQLSPTTFCVQMGASTAGSGTLMCTCVNTHLHAQSWGLTVRSGSRIRALPLLHSTLLSGSLLFSYLRCSCMSNSHCYGDQRSCSLMPLVKDLDLQITLQGFLQHNNSPFVV